MGAIQITVGKLTARVLAVRGLTVEGLWNESKKKYGLFIWEINWREKSLAETGAIFGNPTYRIRWPPTMDL